MPGRSVQEEEAAHHTRVEDDDPDVDMKIDLDGDACVRVKVGGGERLSHLSSKQLK
jgi:hypothetical protein